MKIERRKTGIAEVYTASLNDIMFFLLLFFQIRDQHTELSAPVAEMIDTNDFITELGENLIQRITDDGCSQMANVEVLSNVR